MRKYIFPICWGLVLGLMISFHVSENAYAQFSLPGMKSNTTPQVVRLSGVHWSAAAARPGDQLALAIVVDVADTFHINPGRQQIPEEFAFLIPTELSIENPPQWLTVGPVQYPSPKQVTVTYTGQAKQVAAYERQVIFYLPFVVGNDAPQGMADLQLNLQYQACDEKQCLMPSQLPVQAALDIVAAGSEVSQVADEVFAGFDTAIFAKMLAGKVTDVPGDKRDGTLTFGLFGIEFSINPKGIVGFILLLMVTGVGGFLLNFTPCVLPVIPLKIMSLTRSAGSRRRSIVLGLVMGGGLVFFWVALGAVMAAARGFTATNQLFQYPAFTIGVGVFIAVMAIAMTGLFAIPLPRFLFGIETKHDTVAGAFFFGIMTAVLSTPCTAPFMGSALAWATGQAAYVSLVTFAAIGVGMAWPYVFLSAFPQWVERLPRSGPGSELLKQALGLLMLAAAAYFIGVGLTVVIPGFNYWLLVMLPIAAAGGWVIWRGLRIFRTLRGRMAAVLIGGIIAITGIYGGITLGADEGDYWLAYTPETLTQAQTDGKVVVLDFTAEWCLNCKALEHTVLSDQRVIDWLTDDRVVAMKVDLTGGDAQANAKLAEAGRVSIPVLVIYDTGGKEVFNSDFYTVEQVVDAISKAVGEDEQ